MRQDVTRILLRILKGFWGFLAFLLSVGIPGFLRIARRKGTGQGRGRRLARSPDTTSAGWDPETLSLGAGWLVGLAYGWLAAGFFGLDLFSSLLRF